MLRPVQLSCLSLALLSTVSFASGTPKEKKQTPLIYQQLAKNIIRPGKIITNSAKLPLNRIKVDARTKKRLKQLRLSRADVAALSRVKVSKDLTDSKVFNFARYLELIKAGKNYPTDRCDEVCPKSFEILAMNNEQRLRSPESHLSVINTDEYFAKYRKKTIGYCWGYSATLADFQHLMFFDPENILQQNIPQNEIQRIEFYVELMAEAALNQNPIIIPGVTNIRELTSLPGIEMSLLELIGKKWAKNATHAQSIVNMFVDDKAMKPKSLRHKINRMKEMLQVGILPRIIFADDSPGPMGHWSHVVNVTEIESASDGSHKIFINESNYFPENDQQPYHIFVTPQGTAHYEPLLSTPRLADNPHDRVGRIKFGHEFYNDVIKYSRSLRKMCKKLSGCTKK